MKVPEQPVVNIGLVGHVDHGKTTLTHALTGDWTDRHSEEVKRGISIKLGYADAAFYRCPNHEGAEAYTNQPVCPRCGAKAEFLRAVSFVDAPGHETLMATMLSGAAIMNGALLLIAANEKCPQPQSREHLTALEIIGVKNVVVVQNKIDLVDREGALQSYRDIREFLKGSSAADAPIIPVSANHNANIDSLIEAIEKYIPTPPRDESKGALMYVARSFDINRPGTRPSQLAGGVLGGSLIQGRLQIGDPVEIRPGVATAEGAVSEGLVTTVTSLMSGGLELKSLHAGGLAAIGTTLDPSLAKSDGLSGRVAGVPGTLPKVTQRVRLQFKLLERVVGSQKELKVDKIHTSEILTLTAGTTIVQGKVTSARGNEAEIHLTRPVVLFPGSRIAVSRRLTAWRLIGYGIVQ
jgi:translation initiation factor 2 subunit 3